MNDTEELAETIQTAYQTYLQGRGGVPARSVAARLQPDAVGEDTLSGMRGPFLQALPVANWSDSDWKSFAQSQSLHPNVVRAFHQEGFRRLYDFQERSVETILDGDDTVITAATGRGKTEAWLIPILDQIVKAKRNESTDGRTSTKALLFYPTKALAQDQFKRLVQILYRINRNLRQKEWVTIGIYDGDTPRHIYEDNAQGYLNRTFEHFGCPGRNDDLEKCQSCGQGVFVERSTGDFRLRPDKPECENDAPHDVPLDFVRLTRSGLMDEGADIVLTNPDTVNYRLFNINAETEQNVFVYEPEFVVFDEVHTYDGLLGSYTATLVKRLRRLREERDCDPLQVIGSSATVDNDVELFRQISGAGDVASVSEDPRELADDPPTEIPSELYRDRVSVDEFIEAERQNRELPPQVGSVSLGIDEANELDNERLRERIADDLFDALTTDTPENPAIQALQTLHTELREDPRPPSEFRDWIADRFGLDADQADILLANFQTIGQFSGLLESRHHLFSWPLDGFYACAACSAVYRSPQDSCEECGSTFVSRATYCRSCNDEYLIANACSQCDQLTPYVHTEEGLIGEDEDHTCPYCLAAHGEEVPMHRVLFQPSVECADCGTRYDRSVAETCDTCNSPGIPRADGEFVCRNPECECTWKTDDTCPECDSGERTLLVPDEQVNCPDCGRTHSPESLPTTCDCSEDVTNTRIVPWTCSQDDCDARHATPPDTCDCGDDGPFVKAGLYDIAATVECRDCGTATVPGGTCDCTEPESVQNEDPYRRYMTWTPGRNVESPLDVRSAIPCDHGLWSSVVGDAFTELMRSPTNVSVTTSQYLLRNVADEEGFESAKLLAFSDSHSDMKDLDRSFTEPEVGTVLDQLALCGLSLARGGVDPDELPTGDLQQLRPGQAVMDSDPTEEWVPLSSVLDTGYGLLNALETELAGDSIRDSEQLDLGRVILGTEYIADQQDAIVNELQRRVVRHVGERRSTGGVSLATDGFVDVRIRHDQVDDLAPSERSVVKELVKTGNGALEEGLSEADRADFDQVVDGLVDRKILRREDDRLHFDASALEVSPAHLGELGYDPHDDEYSTSLQARFGLGNGVPCSDTLSERADVFHPRFSERAYTATSSRLAMMLSQLYYGSTPKMDRREIEHQFRDSAHPNFLSSGPTMELGVDIGSLDALLLNGTPPNMNAYLQRVGRAGRSSHSSLVHSVSHRNPIDYYYYEEPTDLITADKQPVPLNEHNERVLQISLAWTVLDYVAATFTIPWNVTRHNVSGGEEVRRRDEASADVRAEAGKFTQLLARSIDELELDEESSRLRPLGIVIDDNERDIREYLTSLFEYTYCSNCRRRFDRDRGTDACPNQDCDGHLVDAIDEYGHLIDDAISAVREVYIDGYRQHANRIEDRVEHYEARLASLEEEFAEASEAERPHIQSECDQLETRINVLGEYLDDLSGESYLDVLREAFGEYAFNLRTISDSVDIQVVDESGEPERIGDDRSGRSSRLALGELHPCAAYLHDRRPHVVSQVFTDNKASEDLRDAVETNTRTTDDEALDRLAIDYVCPDCGSGSIEPTGACECGSTADRQERRLFALDSVEATLDTQPLPNEADSVGTIYENTSTRVQSTFARRETEILSFDPSEQFAIRTETGEHIGTLEYGDYEILEYTDSYRAKYQNGDADDTTSRFELCHEPDCPGVVYTDRDDERRCSVNAEHRPDEDSSAVFARLGYEYETEGVRVSLPDHDSEVVHSFGHGLRLGLQKLSGVTIRDINEYVGTDHVDVFDSQEGGAAVARQVIREQHGDYQNFQTALSLIETQFNCNCDDGCPRCLYQYGCAERNDPNSLERETAFDLVSSGLGLTPL